MWPWLLEWCAELLAGTSKKRRFTFFVIPVLLGACVTLALLERWGPAGLVPVGLVLGSMLFAARDVFAARERLWRAAMLPLSHQRQPPAWKGDESLSAPTAVALNRLAFATDAARRGRFAEANDIVPRIERERLRHEEIGLLQAVRGLVCLGLGDVHLAAQLAAGALPTGADEIDAILGRAILADAWADPDRLDAIDRSWAEAGIAPAGDGTLERLRRLTRLRIDGTILDSVSPADASALSDEAMAVGDEELAAELGMIARRSGAYR